MNREKKGGEERSREKLVRGKQCAVFYWWPSEEKWRPKLRGEAEKDKGG